MHVLTVCYGHPADPAAFDSYYASTHRPLAEKIPGLASFTARHCDSLDRSKPSYYPLPEPSSASREALNAAISPPGRRVADAAIRQLGVGGPAAGPAEADVDPVGARPVFGGEPMPSIGQRQRRR